MSNNTNTPLGCTSTFPLDHAQSKRKTYDKRVNAHRTLEVAEPWNRVEYTYNNNGQILTETYYWDETAEVSKITTVSDCSNSLDEKKFYLFDNNGIRYNFKYNSTGCVTVDVNTNTLKNHTISILPCDDSRVIATATKLYINSKLCTIFSATVDRNILTVTNIEKGSVVNVADVNTGFSFCTSTEGVSELIETITYCYNTNGTLTKISNSSNENVLGKNNFNNVFSLMGNGHVAKINQNGEISTKQSPKDYAILNKIFDQLQEMNFHLRSMTGEEYE